MTTTTSRVLRYGGRELPVTLPSLRDPRLHVAAVLISIHVLGQTALRFQVSVVQILAAIVTAAIVEAAWELRRSGRLVWPASAILTGSGVALIFRVLGTEHGDYWSWRDWHLFAAVAGLSVVTKYAIRYRGSHLFNPSNLGLVVAFLVLGSSRAEPLDFWWAPLDLGMTAAYLIILVGGLVVTARLRLLAMALSFWVTLTAAAGVLAGSGHCMTARWAFEPVCGSHFWWVIVTSPEVLVFLFFMITDPKTVPSGRRARIAFGVGVALASTLLMAPQGTEFGAKVALLAGLVVLTGLRPLFDRLLPEPDAAGTGARVFSRLTARWDRTGLRPGLVRGVALAGAVVVLGAGIVVAGAPAREPPPLRVVPAIPDGVTVDVASLPQITFAPIVRELDETLAGPGGQVLAEALALDLAAEAHAMTRHDRALLAAADAGSRLAEMEDRLDGAADSGQTTVSSYRFETLHLMVAWPYGDQGGPAPALEATGIVEEITRGADGDETSRNAAPFALRFSMERAAEGRWLIVLVEPMQT